ncbi:hypothetical protein P3H15_45775 [Rhodococcus sp. T2V]|uniref:hypothetical protein n=1 Tax=Rhodococcus sp. T2V TaxID=3034164 RepID=UPI0023E1D4CF|nr:hypothetical protein [Rhodococcus sp. T2V]MDF3312268.1 hypothetical protein [Rhodococcus sp. T2V]
MNIFTPGAASIVLAAAAGSTVTTTITNNTGADLFCMVYGTTPGTNPEVDPIAFSAGLGDKLTGGAPDPVTIPAGGSPAPPRGPFLFGS